MWCETTDGPDLGIHLGMSGKIVVADGAGSEIDGGDYWERGRKPGDFRYTRFGLTFEDGGRMVLVDPRRLGRIGLDWPVEKLGPDAATITPVQFRKAVQSGTAPIKARLLDQNSIAGIGNLLADEILWLARINPSRRVADLTDRDVAALLRGLRRAVKSATDNGGVHTLSIVPYRKADALCTRDKAPMTRSTVGGRTSWWCSREQALDPSPSEGRLKNSGRTAARIR
jgi:formamidopyrimidine-DNA glycosylase